PTDHRTDIFSFGAVVYEMLSGRRAFAGATSADTMSAILTAEPPDLADPQRTIPPMVERVVRRCLEKSPDGTVPIGARSRVRSHWLFGFGAAYNLVRWRNL